MTPWVIGEVKMLSDSSKLDNIEEAMNKLLADNDIPDAASNSFGTTVYAFPYLEVLVALNDRMNKVEGK